MKFGVFYVLECRDGKYEKAYGEMLEQIQYADELGFDTVWLAEHHFSEYGSMPSPQVAAAAVAQVTKRMQIGTAISILNFDNPVRMAEDYAMVDVLSNGRLIFGAGRGYQPKEFKGLGVSMENSREKFWECLDIIRGCWTEENFSYQGKYYQVENITLTPRPVQKIPQIVLASISPETFNIAVEKGMENFMVTPTLQVMSGLKELTVEAREKMKAKGLKPWTMMNLQTHIAETAEQALKNVEVDMNWYYNKVFTLTPKEDAPKSYSSFVEAAKSAAGFTLEGLNKDRIVMLADPKEAIEEIRGLERIGIDHLSSWFRVGGLEHKKVMATMKLFAEEVMPAFKEQEIHIPENITR